MKHLIINRLWTLRVTKPLHELHLVVVAGQKIPQLLRNWKFNQIVHKAALEYWLTHTVLTYFLSQQWSGWWLMLGTLSALHCTQQECQFPIASHFWQHCGNTWLWHSAHTNHFRTCFRISVWSLLGSWTQNTFSCLSLFLPPTGQIRMVL
jgi:hypothetical protein